MKKYGVEIQTDPNATFAAVVNWDALHDTRKDAQASAARAERNWHAARVFEVDAPEHVDHLYRNIAVREDETCLYR